MSRVVVPRYISFTRSTIPRTTAAQSLLDLISSTFSRFLGWTKKMPVAMGDRSLMWRMFTCVTGFCSSSLSRACGTRSSHCALVLSPSFLSPRGFQRSVRPHLCRQLVHQPLVDVAINFLWKARAFDAFLLSHSQEAPSWSSHQQTCPRESAAKPSTTLSKLAAWIHHLRRWTTGGPFATNHSQRSSIQNDRTNNMESGALLHCSSLSLSLSSASSISLSVSSVSKCSWFRWCLLSSAALSSD